MTTPTLIWEQHAGQPPVCHAATSDIDVIPSVIRAWLSQFRGRPVTLLHSNDDVLVSQLCWTPCGTHAQPIALLWVEYPAEIMAEMMPARLDARWRGAAAGEAWDVRGDVDVGRRVGR
jgi:hypothetical protein